MYDFVLCLLYRDHKTRLVIICVTVFTSTSIFSLGYVFAQDANTTVIVENRALSPENLVCDDGNHPNAQGICADESHPLVIRANPIPITEMVINETYPASNMTAEKVLAPNGTAPR